MAYNRGWNQAFVESCERVSDSSLVCGTNLTCAPGLELAPDDYGMLDIADWDQDGNLEVLQVASSGATYWKPGLCQQPQPCNLKGVCSSTGRCSCVQGHELSDCSGCQRGYYTRAEMLGIVHDCFPCAGADPNEGILMCNLRGTCHDDVSVQGLGFRGPLTGVVRGNGSCECSESSFSGSDKLGRVSCSQGQCPFGTQEVLAGVNSSGSSGVQICQPCLAGRASSAASLAYQVSTLPVMAALAASRALLVLRVALRRLRACRAHVDASQSPVAQRVSGAHREVCRMRPGVLAAAVPNRPLQ